MNDIVKTATSSPDLLLEMNTDAFESIACIGGPPSRAMIIARASSSFISRSEYPWSSMDEEPYEEPHMSTKTACPGERRSKPAAGGHLRGETPRFNGFCSTETTAGLEEAVNTQRKRLKARSLLRTPEEA